MILGRSLAEPHILHWYCNSLQIASSVEDVQVALLQPLSPYELLKSGRSIGRTPAPYTKGSACRSALWRGRRQFVTGGSLHGHVDFPLLCHDCCMIFKNGCTTVQLVLSHGWLLPAFHDCRWSLRMSLIDAQVFPLGLWQKVKLLNIKVVYI
jgi:hypothetical protein